MHNSTSMDKALAFLHLLCISILFAHCQARISQREWRKLENIHNLIHDEIRDLKTQVWGEVATEIEYLKEKLNAAIQNGSVAEPVMSEVDSDLVEENKNLKQELQAEQQLRQKLEEVLRAHDNQCSLQLHVGTLSTAFRAEKLKSRNLEKKLRIEMNSVMNTFRKKMTGRIESLQGEIDENLDHINETVSGMERLEEDFETVLESHDNMTIMVSQKAKEKSMRKAMLKFGKPGFVSGWILMKSQDEKLSQITVAHGLGALPYKVDVQTRQTREGKWWIFPGVSAFQSDDDTNRPYGGVVYFYNETHITLFAPKKNNNYNLGQIIHTGAKKYTGNDHESSSEAYIRIKAWGSENMPAPDFESDWKKLDIYDKEYSFYEINHHMKDYPALVTVYVHCETDDFNLVSNGIGATVTRVNRASNIGGVVWGFNEESVRIWSLFAEKGNTEYSPQTLVGLKDGWGINAHKFEKFTSYDSLKSGYVKVRAWSKSHFVPGMNFIEHQENSLPLKHHGPMGQDSLESDLFFLSVQAEDGVNKGYRFSGYGGAQAQNKPYGGVVYAYCRDGGISVWSPDPDQHGYSVHIHYPYGNGVNVQATNNVSYVTTWIRS